MTTTSDAATTRAYRGQAPEKRAEERRERLLATALELFATQGYAKTPIEQLCNEARVTTRHFYALFSSREALLAALYDDIMTDLFNTASEAILHSKQPLAETISLSVRAVLLHYLEDSRKAQVGVLEVVSVSADMEKRRRGAIHQMARMVEQYLNALAADNLLPKRDYHLICIALIGGINELLAEWLTAAAPPTIDRLSDDVEFIIHALFRAAERDQPPTGNDTRQLP